ALVNDLDLTVEGSAGIYASNDFTASWSKTGGTPSKIDNLELVNIEQPSGTYTIRVKGANVPTGPQKYALVVFNSGAPAGSIKLDTPKGGEMWKGGDSVNVGWSSSGPLQANSVAVSFSKDSGTTWDPPFVQGQPLNGTSQWTVPMVDTTTGMLRAVAKDTGGGDVEARSGAFTVDSTPPVATVQALPAVTTVANFDVIFTSNDSGSGVKEVEVFYRIGGGAYASAGKTPTSPLPFTATKDGKHEFYASGTDNVGNVEAAPVAAEAFTLVDLVPPSLLSSVPSNGAIDVSPDLTVELKFSEEMDRASVEAGITVTPSATKGSYVWDAAGDKVSFPLTGLSLVTKYDVKVTGKDLAGRDMAAATVSFTTSKIPTNPATLSGKVTDVFTSQGVEGAGVTVTFGALTWTAATDASGAYMVDKLPAGSISISVKKAGYADGTAMVTLTPGGSSTKDFVLTPPGAPYSLIRGTVQDESAAPVEGAEVKTTGVQPVTTLTDGAFELKVSAGTHSVSASKKGMTGEPVEVTVGEWEIKEITIKMKAAPTFDPLSMSVAGIPLLWLLILVIVAIAAVAVASRRRKRGGGSCQWCNSPLRRGAAQCGTCGAAVGAPGPAPPAAVTDQASMSPTAAAESSPVGPGSGTQPTGPSTAPPAGDPSQWDPGPPQE
ncbi:MAG TPA: Ig-like domain-containing protein, partial [Thermoplasmata archaeon]|nr:Ig-like domain-containing protein [Thermoplasmata archaeon]